MRIERTTLHRTCQSCTESHYASALLDRDPGIWVLYSDRSVKGGYDCVSLHLYCTTFSVSLTGGRGGLYLLRVGGEVFCRVQPIGQASEGEHALRTPTCTSSLKHRHTLDRRGCVRQGEGCWLKALTFVCQAEQEKVRIWLFFLSNSIFAST